MPKNNQYKNLIHASKIFILDFAMQVGTWLRTRAANLKNRKLEL